MRRPAEVIILDIQDKAKEKALNIALNKITGKWDNAILKDLLVELDLASFRRSNFTTSPPFLAPVWGLRNETPENFLISGEKPSGLPRPAARPGGQ